MQRILAVMTLLWLLCCLAPTAWAERYKDEKLGYEFVHPKKWERMVLSTDEKWMVAKFNCDREYEAVDEQGFYTMIRPSIDVIVIAKAVKDADGARVKKTKDGVKVLKEAPWKDLKGYLEETCDQYGGFHFSAEAEDEVNGMKVRQYEVTVDKLVTGKRLVYGWEFETKDAYYGLVSHFLADDAKKLGKEILKSFRTFKTFPRTGTLPNTARTGEDIIIEDETKESDEDLTREQLEKRREDATKRALSKIEEGLGKDWKVTESDHYIAVSNADKKYTKELLQHAEALRGWLEDKLGFLGSGYVGKVIIRVFDEEEQYNAYQQSRGWFSDAPEVVTYEDKSGWSDWAMESLNDGLFDAWMKDKNEGLRWAAPSWLSGGLSSFIRRAKSKRRKIEFPADVWDRQGIAVLERDGKLLSAKQFFTMTSEDLWADYGNHQQCEFFVKFLIDGKASKSSKYKSVLPRYLKNLIFAIEEAEAEEEAKSDEPRKEPETEEEEDEMFRKRQEGWRSREKERLDGLLKKTFEGWDDKDWDKFDDLYKKGLL